MKPGIFLGYCTVCGGIWKGDIWSQTLRNWKRWTHLKSMLKDSMQRKCERLWVVKISYSQSQMEQSNYMEEISFWEHPPWYGTGLNEEKSGKIFLENQTGLHQHHFKTHRRMMVKQKRFLVHFRELHLPSSRWTESQTVRVERRVIPNSTEIFRRDQGYKYDLGCDARNAALTIIGISKGTEICQIRGLDSQIHHIGRKTSRWDTHGPGSEWQRSKRHMERHVRRNATQRETKVDYRKTAKLHNARRLLGITSLIQQMRSSKKLYKIARRKFEVPMPAAMPRKIRGRKYKETCRTPDFR